MTLRVLKMMRRQRLKLRKTRLTRIAYPLLTISLRKLKKKKVLHQRDRTRNNLY